MSSIRNPISSPTTLAAANDLNGAGTTMDVSGASGVLIVQVANGTAGTAGIDVVQVSKDGGDSWEAAQVRNAAGALVANGALNAAGVEPTGSAIFSLHTVDGDFNGPTLIRLMRDAAGAFPGASAAWVTGAPSVVAYRLG